MSSFDRRLLKFVQQLRPYSGKYGQQNTIDNIENKIKSIEKEIIILFCGEFKRGKSSLINAILSEGVCPTDVGIATATITRIRYGAKKKAFRYYHKVVDGIKIMQSEEIEWDDISNYTMGDIEHLDNTVYVELFFPSEFLKQERITVLDTPGIGGLDPRHASLTNIAIQEADVILFVTDACEPMTDSEKQFYRDKIVSTGKDNIVLVNKSDSLTDEQLVSHIATTRLALAEFGKTEIVPVSALNWNMYTQIGGQELLDASNKSQVLSSIISLKSAFEHNKLKQLRDLLIAVANEIKKSITLEISQLQLDAQKQGQSINEIIKVLNKLSAYKRDLENPTSQIRLQVSSIFENARNEVANHISHEGTYISATLFNQFLNDERCLSNDGRWLVAQINDRIADLNNEIDNKTKAAFDDITHKLNNEVIDEVTADLGSIGKNIKFGDTFNSQLVFSLASKATVGGIVGGVTYGVVAALASTGLGIVAGLAAAGALIWKRIKTEDAERKKAELRQQLSPQISLAITDIRNNAMTRFTKFNQNLLVALKSMVSEAEIKLKTLQESIVKAKSDNNEKLKHIEELKRKEQMFQTLITQMSLLYSTPFDSNVTE